MKGQTEAVKLGLEVLTPVHVGSGDNLQLNLDYIDQHGQVFVVDQNRTLDAIATGNVAFDSLLQGEPNLQDLVKLANTHYGYTLPPLNRSTSMPKSVREHIKDALFRPYIPGSTLKGAIRTALLAEWLRDKSIENYQDLLPRWVPDKKNPKKTVPSEKRAAFAVARMSKEIFGATPNQDIMRALHIGDTNFQTDDLCLADIRWLNITQFNGKKEARWRDMAIHKSLSQWSNANGLYAEVLKLATVASVTLQWDRFLLSDPNRWKAPSHAKQLLPENFTGLCAVLNTYACHQLKNELAFFEHYGVSEAAKHCRRLLDLLNQDSQAAYLRLAWGSGWRGMTGDWLDSGTLTRMRELYHLGKCLKDKEGKLKPIESFPKTRRLVVQGTPCLPLGWIRLQLWETIKQSERRQSPKAARHPWVEETLSSIQKQNRCQPDEALRGTQLAQAWQAIDDPELKQAALEDIKTRWQEKDWWQNPGGKAAKKALAIYRGDTQ